MALSLRELKEYLLNLGGASITPEHNQLQDLKTLVDDMMTVRSGSPPSTGSGYYSGVTCTGHQQVGEYELSLGDIKQLDIKGCSCNEVNDATGYCTGRTGLPTCTCNVDNYCNCRSRTYAATCDCNTRTAGCNCVSRTAPCTCNLNIHCDCQSREGCVSHCYCDARTGARCDCRLRSTACSCQTRTYDRLPDCTCDARTASCVCQSRTYAATCTCDTRTGTCECVSRTSRNTCTCNGRCACNAENRFE